MAPKGRRSASGRGGDSPRSVAFLREVEIADERVREAMEKLDSARCHLQDACKAPRPTEAAKPIKRKDFGIKRAGQRAKDAPMPDTPAWIEPAHVWENAVPCDPVDCKGKERGLEKVDMIIPHCNDAGLASDMKFMRRVAKERGYSAISYNRFIDRVGTLYGGRPLTRVGAHCKGWNTRSVGICLAGTMDKRRAWGGPLGYTKAQIRTLLATILHLAHILPAMSVEGVLEGEGLYGHRDINPRGRECPMYDVEVNLLPMLREFWASRPK